MLRCLDNPAPPPAAAAAAAAAAAGDDAAPLASSSSPASPSAVISAAAARAALAEASGMRTVPVIYVGGRLVGGFDDLEQLVTSKKLQELLASPADPLPPALIPLLSLKPAADSSADSQEMLQQQEGQGEEKVVWLCGLG
ncbi:hypothetical protein CLOM_g4513 [Closterium sp. NIES-68]|nr:hypothetical protein CLOM_g4513 [Closterium sp. NIES-68]